MKPRARKYTEIVAPQDLTLFQANSQRELELGITTYVVCRLCGAQCVRLGMKAGHLWRRHGLTVKRYRMEYPEAPVKAAEALARARETENDRYQQNPEKFRNDRKQRYWRNPAKYRKRSREYLLKHPGYQKQRDLKRTADLREFRKLRAVSPQIKPSRVGRPEGKVDQETIFRITVVADCLLTGITSPAKIGALAYPLQGVKERRRDSIKKFLRNHAEAITREKNRLMSLPKPERFTTAEAAVHKLATGEKNSGD